MQVVDNLKVVGINIFTDTICYNLFQNLRQKIEIRNRAIVL